MEDTGQDTTIRIGVDGTGVAAGVTSIKRSLADLGTSVKKISDDTNEEIGKIGKGDLKLGSGIEKATKAIIKETGELTKQLKAVETQAFTGFSNIGKSAEAAYVKLAGQGVPENYIAAYIKTLKEAQSVEAKRASDARAAADAIAAANAQAAAAASAIVQKAAAEESHYAELKKQHAAYNQAIAEKAAAALKEELALTNQINEAALRRKYGGSAQPAAYYAEKAGPMAASPNVSGALAGLKAQEEAIRASAEAQKAQQLKILGLNNQIQAARTAAAERVAQETAKIIAIEEHYADLKRQHAAYGKSLADQEIASTKARAAALAAYAAEAQNAELNLIHTGRGKSSAMLIDKGQRLGFTEAEINTYTAGLKKVEAANAAAFAAANPHIGKLKAEAEAAGTSVKGLSASLRNVPAQFTDIIVSLQGGQAPLTVLLQQGGQLKDMFGGIGPAFRALGGYVMSLVNPYTIAAAAVAGLGVAMASINGKDKALLALSTQLEGTGRASVAATGDIKGLIKELNNVPGISKSAATAILGEFAKVQGLGGNMFRGLGASVADFAAATGTDLPSAARKLASAFADPAKGARELDESLGTLTASQIIAIEKMADMGDKARAQAALLDALKEATQGLADQAMTPLGKATEDLSNAWDEMLTNVGNADALRSANSSLAEMIGMVARLTTGLANMKLPAWMGTGFDFTRASFNAFFDYSKPKVAPEGSWGDGGAAGSWAPTQTETDRQVKAALDATKGYTSQSESVAKLKAVASQAKAALGELEAQSKGNSAEAALLRERISGVNEKLADMAKKAKGPKEPISEAAKGLVLYNNLMDRAAGFEKEWEEDVNKLRAALDGKTISQKQFNDSVDVLYKKQPLMVEAAKAEAEAIKAIDKARTDAIKSHAKELESLNEKAQKLEDEVAMYGKSKTAIEELTAARERDRMVDIGYFDNSAEEIARRQEKEAARLRLAAAATAKDNRDAVAKAADAAEKEWKKASEKIEQDITDALMRGFESGEGFAKTLKGTLENMFKTMILRPVIQALVQPVAGQITSLMGSGQGGQGGSIGNIFGGVGSVGGSASGMVSNVGAYIGGDTGAQLMMNADSIGAGLESIGSGLSYFSAAVSLADGKYGAAAGQALGTYFGGPIGGAIGNAVGSALDDAFGGGGGPKSDSSYNMGGFGDSSKTGLAGSYATGVEDAWKTLAKELEITTALKVGALTSIDGSGDAQTIFDASGTVNGQTISSRAGRLGGAENVGRDEAALQAAMAEETTRLLFAALKASDLPEQYKAYLNTIGDSVDDMTEAMTIVAVVDDFNDALQSLPFENLKNLSFEAAKGLIEVAGGMDVLGANLGTYYTNFYSAEEQRAQTIKTINATVGGGFDAASTDAKEFRSIVEAAMLDTSEAGLMLTAKLLGVSGAMGVLVAESEKAEQAAVKLMTDVFDTLEKRLTDLVDSIASERDNVAGARDSILNGGPKTYAELQAGIAGAKVAMPSDARVLAANAAVAVAAANVAAQNNAVNQAKSLTPDAAAMNTAKSSLDAAKAATAVQQAGIDTYMSIEGGRFAFWVQQAQAGNDLRGWVPNPSAEYSAQSYVFNKNAAQAAESPAQTAYDAQLVSYNAALESNAAKVAAAQAVLNDATAAQAAAHASAKAAIMDYAAAMTQYAGDAEKAVKVLGALREQTVAYYEAQKELAGLMTTSAASLREAVRSTRFGQLDGAASLAQQKGAFSQNYSLALSTTGATKAGYADKLGAALPGLSDALMDVSATRADWAVASAGLLSQSEAIAAQLEAEAGGMNYEADSLALLDSIDVALGELDSNTAILKNAIEGGTSTTAAGLRAIVSQLGGVPAFAGGGYHSGGIRLVGENGPELEVTGPSRIFNASQLRGSGMGNTEKLEALVQTLIADNTNMRAELRAIAIASSKTAKILERVTPDGNALQTAVAA